MTGWAVLPPHLLAFVRASLPEPPARVLEVGAGAGELAAALTEAGYDVLAIDPAGGPPHVTQLALNDLDAPAGAFDAAVAVLSLHHVEPLDASCAKLADVVRPGGRLVVDEFDVEHFDERAAAWFLANDSEPEHEHSRTAAELVAHHRGHLHPVARLREALAPGFRLGEPVRGAYLHRWALAPQLREAEEELIAAGRLPATGARLVGVRS